MLFGSGLLSPGIQAVSSALLAGAVPADWTRRWENGPEKPQTWLRELVRKRLALQRWRSASVKGSLLADALNLGDLFSPSTFINALRQQTARKLGVAIDRVKLICGWEKDARKMADACCLPCTVSGMFLQGAALHSGALQPSAPDSAEISAAPPATIGYVPLESEEIYSSSGSVSVPVYLSPSREEFLAELRVPSSGADQGRWVLAGVSLFLSEEE